MRRLIKLLKVHYMTLALAALVILLPLSAQSMPGGNSGRGAEPSVGVDEHPGRKIPLDIIFRDETGAAVRLSDIVSGPTIILPVYYTCRNVCVYHQARMADALKRIERRPVDEYRVISISFDEEETAEMAARSKRTYLTAMNTPFPQEGWRFLTGDAGSIRRLTDSLGYRFRREGKEFVHPVASIVISGDGTIIRYLYGMAVLPKDLALAITEAKSGVSGASVRKLMDFCFSYDPAGKGYVFNLLKVSATLIILCLGSFLAFLLLTGRKRRP